MTRHAHRANEMYGTPGGLPLPWVAAKVAWCGSHVGEPDETGWLGSGPACKRCLAAGSKFTAALRTEADRLDALFLAARLAIREASP